MTVPVTTAFVGVIPLAAETLMIDGSCPIAVPTTVVPAKAKSNHMRTNSKLLAFTIFKQTRPGFECAVFIPSRTKRWSAMQMIRH
jgi:hypothetical protein